MKWNKRREWAKNRMGELRKVEVVGGRYPGSGNSVGKQREVEEKLASSEGVSFTSGVWSMKHVTGK